MSDFKFIDDENPSSPPAPGAPTEAKKEDSGTPAGFSINTGAAPGPNIPSPAIPSPAIPSPAPPVGPAPPVLTPSPGAQKAAAAAAAAAGTPTGQPVVPPVAVPTVATPTVATPTVATPTVAVPPGHKPPGTPLQPRVNPKATGTGVPATAAQARPGGKPAPAPMPAISMDMDSTEMPQEEPSGPPQDAFSSSIWKFGQSIKTFLDALEGPASWLLRVAAVIGITALAYILAACFFGKAGNMTGMPQAQAYALVHNLTACTQAFMICLLLAGVATLILGYEDNRLGFAVCGVGLLCNFVAPIALKKFVGDTSATAHMAPIFRHFGYYIVMVGLFKGVCDTAVWLWNLPETLTKKYASVGVANQAEAKQRIIAREANMTSPCWRLPFCRESIRKQCPAFLARKTCWKFGRGCYCDEEMISRIVRGEALDAIKSPTRQSRQGKPPCGRCYIYLEHQTYKFRVMSPLALPLAVITTWLVWPAYAKAFTALNHTFDSVLSTLSFNTTKITPDALQTTQDSLREARNLGNSPAEVMHIAQNMIGFLLGFMLLIYISKFIEWAIFKAKW